MPRLLVQTKAHQHKYEIRIGRGLMARAGAAVRQAVGGAAQRTVLISNKTVFARYGPAVMSSLEASGFDAWPWLIGDGEKHKSTRTVEKTLSFLSERRLERNDCVVALGGGIVGDVAGFAAATYMRGIPLVQIPTTLLAQIDSSVGGKTGVNLPTGKNLVGAFHQPSAVIIDIETLSTLPQRELVGGWCESVKQGAVANRRLFTQTINFLRGLTAGGPLITSQLEALIGAHCAFKASIVAGDEREDRNRNDRRSRRILNFGHTVAHALETVTQYRRFRHGEAVGYGMLVAAELSKHLGLLPSSELELIREGVALCGPLPPANDLDLREIANAIGRDKKNVGGHLQWVLLEAIGHPRILDGKAISVPLLQQSLNKVLRTR
ncbi:MAG TPA: 3-dehydroquinate synthase [Pyrinomonadaceae bacterium]|nr:3-dehydroquinate synthase [Pyrinomonadaceae bacterium]